MPGFVTHWLFLQSYYQSIPTSPLADLQRWEKASNWGALGPDVFYYDPIHSLRAVRRFGVLLHSNRVEMSQRNLLQSVMTQRDTAAKAYAVGYISHCVLDTVCHPYIYAFAGQYRSMQNRGAHYALETDIDRLLLQQSMQLQPNELQQFQLLDCSEREQRCISEILSRMCTDTYRSDVIPRQIANTMKNARRCMKLLQHQGGAAKVRSIEQRLLGYPCLSGLMVQNEAFFTDPFNFGKRQWTHPWTGVASTQNFLELMATARNQMLSLTPSLEKALLNPPEGWRAILDFLGNRSLKTGLQSDSAAE